MEGKEKKQEKMTIGQIAVYLARIKGYSNMDLAELLQTNPTQVSRWKTAKAEPRPETVEAISRIIGYPVAFFHILTLTPKDWVPPGMEPDMDLYRKKTLAQIQDFETDDQTIVEILSLVTSEQAPGQEDGAGGGGNGRRVDIPI